MSIELLTILIIPFFLKGCNCKSDTECGDGQKCTRGGICAEKSTSPLEISEFDIITKTVNGKKYIFKPGADLRSADLREAKLKMYKLMGADLRSADLNDAKLDFADLREAKLDFADLREADLREADLRNASLYGTYLKNADLREAKLMGADLRSADLNDAKLEDANLTGAIYDSNFLKNNKNLLGKKQGNKYRQIDIQDLIVRFQMIRGQESYRPQNRESYTAYENPYTG